MVKCAVNKRAELKDASDIWLQSSLDLDSDAFPVEMDSRAGGCQLKHSVHISQWKYHWHSWQRESSVWVRAFLDRRTYSHERWIWRGILVPFSFAETIKQKSGILHLDFCKREISEIYVPENLRNFIPKEKISNPIHIFGHKVIFLTVIFIQWK